MDSIQGEGGSLRAARGPRRLYGRLRPDSARIAVSLGLLRASMKLSTQSGQVESVVVFVAKIVTTTCANARRLFSSILPRALHNLTSLRIIQHAMVILWIDRDGLSGEA